MTNSISLPLLNAIFFLVGSDRCDVPEMEKKSQIWSTSTCIAVGCTPDSEGETKITVGPCDEVDPMTSAAFDGQLATPARAVKIEIVSGETVLVHPTTSPVTRIRIWTNHPTEPNDVLIGLG